MGLGRRAISWLREHEPDCRDAAADYLLEIHNDAWNEGPLTDRDTFVERMRLESIVVDPTSERTLYYHDGGLFWGHSIVVPVLPDEAFGEAHIAG